MRITLYMDVYPGCAGPFYATSSPGEKIDPAKRYKFIVEIDDPNDPDEEEQVRGLKVK